MTIEPEDILFDPKTQHKWRVISVAADGVETTVEKIPETLWQRIVRRIKKIFRVIKYDEIDSNTNFVVLKKV